MTIAELDAVIDHAKDGGCRRVLCCPKGAAYPPAVAKRKHGITPTVIYVRNDGWTLGAPRRLQDAAFALWKEYWVAMVDVPTRSVTIFETTLLPPS